MPNGLTKHQIFFYMQILKACDRAAKVAVYDLRTKVTIEGIARNVVEPDSVVFAQHISPKSRLWITGRGEHFIPLENIAEGDLYVYE